MLRLSPLAVALFGGLVVVTSALAQGSPMKPTVELTQAKDTASQAIRAARNLYFDRIAPPDGVSMEARSRMNVPAPPPIQRLPPPMDELPATLADAIVLGKIVSVQAFFSKSRGAIYTESTVQIEEVMDAQQAVSKGKTLVLVQEGGSTQTASGSTYTQTVNGGGDALQNGGQYLFFLRYLPGLQAYACRKAWQFLNGVVSAVSADDLARVRAQTSIYQGMSTSTFLSVARTLKATLDHNH
jgi:hypothetical protein